MSDGDDEPADAEGDADAEGALEAASFEDALAAVTAPLEGDEVDADALGEALDAVDDAAGAAGIDAELDELDAALDDVEAGRVLKAVVAPNG